MKISNLKTDTVVENQKLYRNKKIIKRHFIESFIYCLSLYRNFKGRTSRKDYWSFILVFFFFVFILNGIDIGTFINIPLSIYLIIFILPLSSGTIRRLHDTGHVGWFIFVPFINIYLLFKKGHGRMNRYGSNPLYE